MCVLKRIYTETHTHTYEYAKHMCTYIETQHTIYIETQHTYTYVYV